MIKNVAIEGIDGSGKTTVGNKLAELLRADGLKAVTFAPYRLANERLGEDIYAMWSNPQSAKAAVAVLRQVFDDCEVQADAENADVVIYDRHWMTAFTEISTNPELVGEWGDMFVPAALLRVEPSVATERQANDASAPWSDASSQEQYASLYKDVAANNIKHLLSIYRSGNDATPACIARAIESDLYYRR